MTPNPATMKFVADRPVIETGKVAEFNSAKDASKDSGLAAHLFKFPFVQGVFITSNFITVAKTPSIEWEMISAELREFISQHLMENEFAATTSGTASTNTSEALGEAAPKTSEGVSYAPQSEVEKTIITLLDEYVRPAVEGDGGRIDFKSFRDGVVTVTLRGSCSGCPSSSQTLKGGIENLLRSKMTEVKSVVAEEM